MSRCRAAGHTGGKAFNRTPCEPSTHATPPRSTASPSRPLPRTLLDLADVVSKDHLIKAITQAEIKGIIDLRALEALMARSPGRRGHKPLGEILSDAVIEPHTRQELEHRFLQLIHEAKLPRPLINTLVEGYQVDAVWPHAKIIVELDSWEFHRHRNAFEGDRERDFVLTLAKYRVVRITWRQLTRHPETVIQRLRDLLWTGSAPSRRSTYARLAPR
jgi:very-short-patch-repair endonuclease